MKSRGLKKLLDYSVKVRSLSFNTTVIYFKLLYSILDAFYDRYVIYLLGPNICVSAFANGRGGGESLTKYRRNSAFTFTGTHTLLETQTE
jgi:hypothetical protein